MAVSQPAILKEVLRGLTARGLPTNSLWLHDSLLLLIGAGLPLPYRFESRGPHLHSLDLDVELLDLLQEAELTLECGQYQVRVAPTDSAARQLVQLAFARVDPFLPADPRRLGLYATVYDALTRLHLRFDRVGFHHLRQFLGVRGLPEALPGPEATAHLQAVCAIVGQKLCPHWYDPVPGKVPEDLRDPA